jgi:hypothetical protein
MYSREVANVQRCWLRTMATGLVCVFVRACGGGGPGVCPPPWIFGKGGNWKTKNEVYQVLILIDIY